MTTDQQNATWAGISFDGALIAEVQRRVLSEGICPSSHTVTECLYAAYAGYAPPRPIIGEAAAHVWAERRAILAATVER